MDKKSSGSKTKIDEYIDYLSGVRNVSPATLAAYSTDLADFAAYCDNFNIVAELAKKEDLQLYISDMSFEQRASVSVNRSLSALRGFFKYLVRFEYRKDNPAEALRNIKTPKNLPSFLWEAEMKEFASLPQNAGILWPARDKALIMLLYSGGLRISEALGLRISDIEKDYSGARVIGKGNKERAVFFSDEGRAALGAYLAERGAYLAERHVKKCGIKTGGAEMRDDILFLNMRGDPLTTRGAAYIINRYEARSRSGKNVHPHSFRHSFATHLMNRGCDIRVVQELLGHKSLSTTQVYTHTNIEHLKDVYKNAHPHA